jgi:aldose 1-epimerase
MKNLIALIFLALLLTNCSQKPNQVSEQKDTLNGWKVYPPLSALVHELKNKNGVTMSVIPWGGRIVSLSVPDKNGIVADVVTGYDTLDQYYSGNPYFGAMIGRYGNRIAKGKFSLDGNEYQLAVNNGENALHGGPGGFHNVMWQIEPSRPASDGEALTMSYVSEDGEEGYPGNLSVKVTYTLTEKNEVIIDYEATVDKPTVLNLTHHSFFNLAGAGNGDVLGHQMMINADRFCPVDSGLIPTGELKAVAKTPFDFNLPHTIGERIGSDDQQLKYGKGYDHNWVLNKKDMELELAAKVIEPVSGRVMEVWTTEPGLQFYSGNFLDGSDIGKGGKPYGFRSAFCLEAQHFPDSPNKKDFPSVVLRPGEKYTQRTIYKFDVVR